jgi:hypothetical protein
MESRLTKQFILFLIILFGWTAFILAVTPK